MLVVSAIVFVVPAIVFVVVSAIVFVVAAVGGVFRRGPDGKELHCGARFSGELKAIKSGGISVERPPAGERLGTAGVGAVVEEREGPVFQRERRGKSSVKKDLPVEVFGGDVQRNKARSRSGERHGVDRLGQHHRSTVDRFSGSDRRSGFAHPIAGFELVLARCLLGFNRTGVFGFSGAAVFRRGAVGASADHHERA